jgi:hypothetical protein
MARVGGPPAPRGPLSGGFFLLTAPGVPPILAGTMEAPVAGRTGFFGYYFSPRLPAGPVR